MILISRRRYMGGSSRGPKAVLATLVTLILSLWLSAPANGQAVGATLSGTVSDASGAALVDATVLIQYVATGVTREAKADSAGFYSAPNLTPGSYKVTVTAAGFSTLVRTGLTLTVGAQQQLN